MPNADPMERWQDRVPLHLAQKDQGQGLDLQPDSRDGAPIYYFRQKNKMYVGFTIQLCARSVVKEII